MSAWQMAAFDRKETIKDRLSGNFVRERVMSQVRRRRFLIAAAKAIGVTVPQSLLCAPNG